MNICTFFVIFFSQKYLIILNKQKTSEKRFKVQSLNLFELFSGFVGTSRSRHWMRECNAARRHQRYSCGSRNCVPTGWWSPGRTSENSWSYGTFSVTRSWLVHTILATSIQPTMTFKPELLSWLQYCTWQKHPIMFTNEPAKKKALKEWHPLGCITNSSNNCYEFYIALKKEILKMLYN